MKQGGSGGGRVHPMPRPFRCSICNRSYAMQWAKNNHEKLHKEYVEARGSGA